LTTALTIPPRNAGYVPVAREQRKLTAILAADVVGYSRLMGRNEIGTQQIPARQADAVELWRRPKPSSTASPALSLL
jgi:hypothetical protein